MHIVVKANQQQKQEFLSRSIPSAIQISWMENDLIEADVYFDLQFEEKASFSTVVQQPVFVNAVFATCKELPVNYIRINAWNGFLMRPLIEVASGNDFYKGEGSKVLKALGWDFQFVVDEPGMIAARIISMIINEAYFALGEKVSSKEEIDIAMKLGTNYPYGPFEWSENIGLHKIYTLLKKLNEQDERYSIAPALINELN